MPVLPSRAQARQKSLVRNAGLNANSTSPSTSSELRGSSLSDACIPGVAILGGDAAQALAEFFQIVCHRQLGDEFYVLVADLPGESHAKRPTVRYRKLAAVHPVAEKCLRMQSVGHVDAVPGIGFHRRVDNVFGLRMNSRNVQHMRERD